MKLTCLLPFLLTAFMVGAQTKTLRINPTIVLPKDSAESKRLISAINDFLSAAQKPNEENRFVLESEKIETFILLDEINGIEKHTKLNDNHFYRPYLTNIVSLKDHQYLIQVSYIGIQDSIALLRAVFEFMAYPVNDHFVFSSTLLKHTQNWHIKREGSHVFHYQQHINKTKVKEISRLSSAFDRKLKSENKTTDYYCCENIMELQKLIGVIYKSDYNGRTSSIWSAITGNRKLLVLGNNNADFNNFDPHDLWHDRLSLVIARSKVNKPVDEGCAYLYGGSWGFTWDEIFKAFKEQIAANKNTNWKEIKETPVYFKTKEFKNSADYIVNALLVQKIEKEKGFAGVWEFLTIGPFEKGNEKYYQTLEKLTGITRENYNENIWQLINNQH